MDRLSFIFNCLLVATGLLQAIALGFTVIVTNKAANAAKAAAEAIPIMERPYIFIHGITFHREQQPPCITYNVSNNGKLAAKVENIKIGCGMELRQPPPLLLLFPPVRIEADHPLLQEPILSSQEKRTGIKYDKIPNDLLQLEGSTRWPIDGLIFRVVVTYRWPIYKRTQDGPVLAIQSITATRF